MRKRTCDAIIIGSGQGGNPLAKALADSGRQTVLVERDAVGGTCINYGCTPTKTMIASGRVAYLARRGKNFGIDCRKLTVDMKVIRQRKRDIVESFRSGSEKRIEETDNLELLRGTASFIATKTLRVITENSEAVELSADTIVIDAGTRPAVPDVPGLPDVPYLDSTSIMELDDVPELLVVLGGGYIGLEFGQLFRRLGAKVTIIQRGDQLLSREDEDVAEEVRKIIKEDGVTVLLESSLVRVERSTTGKLTMIVEGNDGQRTLTGSHLFVAAGRQPNSDTLDTIAGGIDTDKRGFILVNEKLETSVPGVYAIGDIKGGPAFTHISYDDYRILKANLLDGQKRTTEGRLVPYSVFIDPQLGRVGMNEKQARENNVDYAVAKMPMSYVARALEIDEARGFLKVLVDKKTKRLLGCSMLAIEGGELMNMVQIAMMGKLTFTALRDSMFAHPTLGESLNNLFAGLNIE